MKEIIATRVERKRSAQMVRINRTGRDANVRYANVGGSVRTSFYSILFPRHK